MILLQHIAMQSLAPRRNELSGTALQDFHGLLTKFDGVLKVGNFGIERAENEVVNGSIGGQCEKNILIISGAGLCLGAAGFKGAADAAPKLDFVAQIKAGR